MEKFARKTWWHHGDWSQSACSLMRLLVTTGDGLLMWSATQHSPGTRSRLNYLISGSSSYAKWKSLLLPVQVITIICTSHHTPYNQDSMGTIYSKANEVTQIPPFSMWHEGIPSLTLMHVTCPRLPLNPHTCGNNEGIISLTHTCGTFRVCLLCKIRVRLCIPYYVG